MDEWAALAHQLTEENQLKAKFLQKQQQNQYQEELRLEQQEKENEKEFERRQ